MKSLYLLLMFFVIGCGTYGTGGIVSIGPDLYMLGELGGMTDFSSSGVKARLYKTAAKYCEDKSLIMSPVSSTGKDSGMGTYASAEIQFRCLKPNDTRLKDDPTVTLDPRSR